MLKKYTEAKLLLKNLQCLYPLLFYEFVPTDHYWCYLFAVKIVGRRFKPLEPIIFGDSLGPVRDKYVQFIKKYP